VDDKHPVIQSLMLKAARQVLRDHPETVSASPCQVNRKLRDIGDYAAVNIGLIIGLLGAAGFTPTETLHSIHYHLTEGRCVPFEDVKHLDALIAAYDN
jgi:hypothetical protein